MKKWIFLSIIALAGIIQVTFFDYLRIFNLRPDLLLICVVVASLHFRMRSALIFAVCAGIFKDIFTAAPFGVNTVLFSLWCFLIVELCRQIPVEEELFQLAVAGIIVLLHNIAYGVCMLTLGNFVSLGIFLRILIFQVIISTLCFPLISRISKPAYS